MISRIRVINVSTFKRSHLTSITLSLLHAVGFRRSRVHVKASARTTPYLAMVVILNVRRLFNYHSMFVVRNRHFFVTCVHHVNGSFYRLCRTSGPVIRSYSGLEASAFVRRTRSFCLGTTGPIYLGGCLINRQLQARSSPQKAMVFRLLFGRFPTLKCCFFRLFLHVDRAFLTFASMRECKWVRV